MTLPLPDLTHRVLSGQALDRTEISAVCAALLDPGGSDDEKAAFLSALGERGETPDEVAGFVEALLGHAVDPQVDPAELPGPLLDVCGTGGDRAGLFNVSTAALFVAAAAGACVAKHGNRSITSRSGGADVLEALGIPIHLDPAAVRESLRRHRAAFLFAPDYHPAFKAVAGARKRLAAEGRRTVFNILGPLLNPARPPYQLVGVFSPAVLEIYPDVLARLGRRHAWVVHGTAEGAPLDEISVSGPTDLRELAEGVVRSSRIDLAEHGIPRAPLSDLVGGDAVDNARRIVAILEGNLRDGSRDMVVANAAGALCAAGLASGFDAGIDLAQRTIDRGEALDLLRAMQAG